MMELGWIKEDMVFADAPQKAELQGFYDKIKRITEWLNSVNG
jgi:hypothetical protein